MRSFGSVQLCSFLLGIFRVNHALTLQKDNQNGCEEKKVEENVFRISPIDVPSEAKYNYTDPTADIFKAIANDSDIKQTSDVVDNGYYTSLCWSEITTFTDKANGSKSVTKEYAITFETEADIPEEHLDGNLTETQEYMIYDQQTKKSQIVNFTTVSRTQEEVVRQNRNMFCGSGPVYSKEYVEWPRTNKKRLEIKVSPKRYNLKISPVYKQLDQQSGRSTIDAGNISPPSTTHKVENSSEALAGVAQMFETLIPIKDSSDHITQRNYETSTDPTTSVLDRLSITSSLPATVDSDDGTLMEVSDRIGISDNITSDDESFTHAITNPHQQTDNINKVVSNENLSSSKCAVSKHKILVTVRVSINHMFESGLIDSKVLPLMNLKKEVDIPIASIPEVLTVPNKTINEEWNRFLEDIGTYFFNLNKKIIVNFTDLIINTINKGDSFFIANEILPSETLKRIKIVKDQINACKVSLKNDEEVHLPAQYGYNSKQYSYLYPSYFKPKSKSPVYYPPMSVFQNALKNPYGSYSFPTHSVHPAYIPQNQQDLYPLNWLMPNKFSMYAYSLPNYLQRQ